MSQTLRELAELVRGEVVGDGALLVHGAKPLSDARSGDITFLEKVENVHFLHECQASAVVVPRSVPANGQALIRVDDPLFAFVKIVQKINGLVDPPPHGIDPKASVHPTARVGADPSVFPFAVIGAGSVIGARCRIHSGVVIGRNCTIGDDTILYPNAVLYDNTVLGNRVIVHANVVLGADGFGYRQHNGRHVKVPQLGNVEIGDDAEIGACTTIDRSTFQATLVGEGTKLDNHVQIGHNCRLGRHNMIVSQVGIAGSSSTGDYVVIAGQVGIVGHIHIGDGVQIGAKAGVTKDVPAGQRILGAPATPEREQKRIMMSLEKLPEMRKDLKKIKQHLNLP